MILEAATPMEGAQGWSSNLDLPMPVIPLSSYPLVALNTTIYNAPAGYDYIDVPANEVDGQMLSTVMDTWYYRLHFYPAALNFGNLSGDQQLKMYLWNANFAPVDLEAFDIVNGTGVTYDTDFPVPGTLPQLQQAEYTFFASANGPPLIDATATWTIDGVVYEVPVTGRRSVLFPFKPNWKSRYTETLSWKTTVQTSYSGKFEQCIRIRDIERRAFQYALRLKKDDAVLFDLLTFGWRGRMYSTPIWSEGSRLTAAPNLGDTVLQVDTRYRTFKPGSTVAIMKSTTEYEMVQIDSLTDSTMTLTDPIQQELGQAMVYPIVPCLLDGPVSTSRQSSMYLDAAVRLAMSPVDGALRTPVIAPAATFMGVELYTKETNWREPLSITVDPRDIVVDNTLGPMSAYPAADFPLITRGFKWLVKNRADGHDLLGFFGRREGRFKPVWIPSGTDDMFLAQPALGTDIALYMRPFEYTSLIAGHPARRYVVFLMRDGSRPVRKIQNVDRAGGFSVLTLDEPLGFPVTPDNVKRISYLGYYRLGGDDVQFVWHTDTVAEVEVNFVLKEPAT